MNEKLDEMNMYYYMDFGDIYDFDMSLEEAEAEAEAEAAEMRAEQDALMGYLKG